MTPVSPRRITYFRYFLMNMSVLMGLFGFLNYRTTIEYLTMARDYVFHHEYSIEERQEQTQPEFAANLQPYLDQLGIDEKPAIVKLVAFKDAKTLHLFAGNSPDSLKFVKSYPILAASGEIGPKLMEGDRQVPEGIYGIEYLNPNSLFFLSMKLTYPNDFEKQMGQRDRREKLGFDIMIHGKSESAGCLAMGDQAIAELFYLASTTDLQKWTVIIAPTDFRNSPFPEKGLARAPWVKDLYMNLKTALMALPWPARISTAANND